MSEKAVMSVLMLFIYLFNFEHLVSVSSETQDVPGLLFKIKNAHNFKKK